MSCLFTQCESKWTEFDVNKNIKDQLIFNDADGFVDTSFLLKTIDRANLDISEKATIKSVTLKGATVNLTGLPGNVPQKLKIEGFIKPTSLLYAVPFFTFSAEQLVQPSKAFNLVANTYLLASGTDEINKFLSDNLRFQKSDFCTVYLKISPVEGNGKRINLGLDLDLDLNIQYTDCFVTGNIGKDDCK